MRKFPFIDLSKFSQKQLLLSTSLFFSLLLLVTFILIYGAHHKKPQRHEATFVSVASVIQKDETVYAEVIGNVQAPATVLVKSLVDGQLLKVGFKPGEFVKKGQVLFEIDRRPFEVALKQAQANLEHDQAQLKALSLGIERNRKLLSGKYIAQQDFDQLLANYASAKATVDADNAQLSNAALLLSYCTITAPLDGRTGDLLVNVGNLVKANDTSPLTIINQLSPIDVKFSISEKQFVGVKEHADGKEILVKASLDANPSMTKEGKIDFVDNTVDTQTGMIQLKASFQNNDYYFWPGQFVLLTLPIMQLHQALLLPTRTIQAGQNGQYVFLVTKDHMVKIKHIETGPAIGDQTTINSGLERGDLVVSEGQLNLTENMTIKY